LFVKVTNYPAIPGNDELKYVCYVSDTSLDALAAAVNPWSLPMMYRSICTLVRVLARYARMVPSEDPGCRKKTHESKIKAKSTRNTHCMGSRQRLFLGGAGRNLNLHGSMVTTLGSSPLRAQGVRFSSLQVSGV
jgi:hypothetical protein